MPNRLTVIRRLMVACLAVALAATVTAPLFAQEDAKLKAQVVAFQQSLKAAWDANDPDAVLTHFQHGDVLPPTRSQYSMLGRFPFWDRPLASVTRNLDGTIAAEFVMDPGADSPAVRMSFTLIVAADGRLQVKSTATDEQLDEVLLRLEREEEAITRTAALAAALETRPAFESELFPIFLEQFWKLIEKEAASAGQELTREIREAFVFRPLGEVHGADKAVLIAVMGFSGPGGGTELVGAGLIRQGDGWTVTEEPVSRRDGVEEFLGDSSDHRVVRGAGLQIDQLSNFYQYLRTEVRRQYRAAEEAGDITKLMALLDRASVGRPLLDVWDTASWIDTSPDDVTAVSIGRQQLDGSTGIITVEVTNGDGDVELRPTRVAREGDGWVLVGPYQTPSDRTRELLNDYGVALRDYKDTEGSYPEVDDLAQLNAALEALQPDFTPAAADAWGTPFRYVVSDDGDKYRLISAGADKAFNHGDWDPTPKSIRDMESLDINEDIIHENGRFSRWHKRGIW